VGMAVRGHAIRAGKTQLYFFIFINEHFYKKNNI